MSNFTYLSKDTPKHYICSNCGAKNVKLWRRYMSTSVELMCVDCACEDQDTDYDLSDFEIIGRMVAAVPNEDGNDYWGHTAEPSVAKAWWTALPMHESE